jgi:peptidylprolyl isomerase/peptidyl-prolyl cis-trans isomerase B (cyclophilin B)
MKIFQRILLSLLSISTFLFINNCQKEDNNDNQPATVYNLIEFQTNYGEFYMWLYDETPLHKENFIKLVKQNFYDSLIFHRVIKNFVIQGGDPTGTGTGGPGYTIPAEFDSTLKHSYGEVGAARLGNTVNPKKESSGSQFYIVQNKNGAHHLDMEYTVFGKIIQGMDIVDSIANVKVNTNYRPIKNVYMTKVNLLTLTDKELLDIYDFIVPL